MEIRAPLGHDGQDPPALSVAACVAAPSEPVAVRGYVVICGDVATISDLLAESYPPQPGGAWLRIRNPEQIELGETSSFADTTWTSQPIRLVGRCVDNEFVIGAPSAL